MCSVARAVPLGQEGSDLHVGVGAATLRPGRTASADLVVRGLLREFARGNGPGRVTVLTTPDVVRAYRDLAMGPVSFHMVGRRRLGGESMAPGLRLAAALAHYERDLPKDLDLVHYPITVPAPRVRLPTVVTLHDVLHHDRPEVLPRSLRFYRRFAYDRAARSATLVAADSEYGKSRIVERLGISPERIEVVHLGVDEDYRPEARDEDDGVLRSFELPERFVLYPATYWHHKNHERLIDAFAALRDTELALVLTGNPYGRLRGLVERGRRLGIEQRVIHLGQVDRGALPALYRRADALVFPSLYEGFGAPPLEAMASGCPVACSPRAALTEICGDAALYFEPEDPAAIAEAIERLTSDSTLRAELRAAGFRRAGRFGWPVTAARYAAVYGRAVGLGAADARRSLLV